MPLLVPRGRSMVRLPKRYEILIVTGCAAGFITARRVSQPKVELPSAKYQLVLNAGEPTLPEAATNDPLWMNMLRSATMGWSLCTIILTACLAPASWLMFKRLCAWAG